MVLEFRLAEPADYDEIAALLRAPMGTRWGVAYDCPAGLAAACDSLADRWQAVVARQDGRVRACGFRFVHRVRLAGEERWLGYLAWLRRAADFGGLDFLRVLRRSMALLRAQRRSDECAWDLTSIFADNDPARRLLERGMRDLPTYHPLQRYRSVVMTTAWRGPPGTADIVERPADDPDCCDLLAATAAGHRLSGAEPRVDGFLLLSVGGRPRACIGWRDDRARRQTLLTDLPPLVAWSRWPLNFWRGARRLPRIPAAGQAVDCWQVGGIAVTDGEAWRQLLGALTARARRAGVGNLLLGACVDTPLDRLLGDGLPAERQLAQWYAVGDPPSGSLQPAHLDVGWL